MKMKAIEMTGKQKLRKRARNKMKALIEKKVTGSCSSNDSDTDVDIIFDENTSNNSVEEISTGNINTIVSNDNNNLQSTNVYPEKIQQKFVTVELFNTFYDDYIEHKHYINDILESVKVNGNILSQFTETNDLEKSYQSKIKSLEENVEELKTENKRLVEEAANYLRIIENLPKGHTPTQNNEHDNQLQKGDLQWEHQQYNKNIRNIKKQQNKQSKQIHNHHQQAQVIPGNTSYADMVKKGKNFTILGDSIIGGIK